MANNENERLVGITKVNETDIICGRGGLGMCYYLNAIFLLYDMLYVYYS